jgi:hypothetical protein
MMRMHPVGFPRGRLPELIQKHHSFHSKRGLSSFRNED